MYRSVLNYLRMKMMMGEERSEQTASSRDQTVSAANGRENRESTSENTEIRRRREEQQKMDSRKLSLTLLSVPIISCLMQLPLIVIELMSYWESISSEADENTEYVNIIVITIYKVFFLIV